jgi:hypothetical protein
MLDLGRSFSCRPPDCFHDYDVVKERTNDIIYSDRNSHYDEMVADLVTDYTDLIDKLKELAKSHFKNKDERDLLQNEFESFLRLPRQKVKELGVNIENTKIS